MNRPGEENSNITQLLREWGSGNQEALVELVPLIYAELHRQAAINMRRERSGHTLQPTALINEVYLKLSEKRQVNWENRTHFFAVAAQSMRRILVDHARAKNRDKRGGGEAIMIPLEEGLTAAAPTSDKGTDLIALDEALTRLAAKDARQAQVVEFRYFSGLSLEETAEVMNLSRATVASEWALAKVWLLRELTR